MAVWVAQFECSTRTPPSCRKARLPHRGNGRQHQPPACRYQGGPQSP